EMRLVYQSHVWADEGWRAFTCRHHPHGFWLEVQGIGCFAVDAAGQAVTCTVRAEGAPLDAVIQAATGAPLMLALALRGTWSLHASAALIHGKLAAFAADSGTGKSTLARTLDEMGARRAADDILPVTLDEGQGHAWPHFPQLKLPLDRQPGLGLPERLP